MILSCFLASVLLGVSSARAELWYAGGFSFSDELGGFKILAVSGSGTSSDPVVILEEVTDLRPAVLIIRNLGVAADGISSQGLRSFLSLAMVKVVINRTERVWGAFDMELQQIPQEPSTYGDGLSFDQTSAFRQTIFSDRFSQNRQLQEPYDRIHFFEGFVDPGARARFDIFITDPTPIAEFYLVQEPQFLSAKAPRSPNLGPLRASLAALPKLPVNPAAPQGPR